MFQSARTRPGGEAAARTLVRIVADSGPAIGLGHVGRCLALWEALGGEGTLTTRDPGARAFLEARGVPAGDGEDAPVTVLDSRTPTSEAAVRELQSGGRRVCLLDDLGDGRAAADMVVDPPTAAAWPPAAGRRLSGFEHVLLRGEIRGARRAPDPAGVFLSMGGSDPAGLTVPLARALAEFEPTVALGPAYAGEQPPPAVRLLAAQEQWPAALAGTALFVSGYGHSLLEAAYLGVPAVSVVFLPEHLQHAQAFCANGTAQMVDMTAGARPAELAALVRDLLADDAARDAMAARGTELVDGRGADRVATALRELA
jgi:hypothetical protein